MNKVFKVIWSEARNAYVVVSEIAKNHGSKSCSTKKLLTMLIATGVMTCASMAPAMAADPPAEALKHSTVAAGYNITVTPKDNSDGGKEYNVDLKNDIYLAGDDPDALVSISGSKGTIWATGSVTVGSGVDGSVVMDGTTATLSGLGNKTTAYDEFANGKGKAATEEQLKEVATEAGKHTQVKAGTNVGIVPSETADGTHVYTVNADGTTVSGDSNVLVTAGEKDANNVTNYGVKLNKDLKGIESVSNGDAKLALNGAAGYAGIVNGKGASVYMQGSTTVINNKVSVDKDGKISGVAAGKISADSTDAVNGSQLHAVATEAGKHSKVVSGNNINVEETDVDGQKIYKVNLNKDIILGDLTGKNVSISGTNGTIETTGYIATKDRVYADKGAKLADIDVTGNKISNGASSIVLDGSNVKVNDKVTIDQNGKVTGVADGDVKENSKDAVNGSQLYKTNQEVVNNTNRINQLGSRVNKVGAGAAALAALHPMDFDPDDKLTFSAGYGNYGGENAAAIGAYYRPDEKVMFSIGGTVGNGENMVNAGVSFSLDRTNHVSNSRTAMAREILDLRAEVTELKAMVAKGGLGSIAEDKMKIFPDVAENHWAYEYVGKLAAAGIIEGYPDGKFSGDRMMSRYEFAAMLYRAMQKGAQLDSKIINEFAPEMGRIRVDRISGEDGDRDKIERVRVNAVKGERDHYGNKLAK